LVVLADEGFGVFTILIEAINLFHSLSAGPVMGIRGPSPAFFNWTFATVVAKRSAAWLSNLYEDHDH